MLVVRRGSHGEELSVEVENGNFRIGRERGEMREKFLHIFGSDASFWWNYLKEAILKHVRNQTMLNYVEFKVGESQLIDMVYSVATKNFI